MSEFKCRGMRKKTVLKKLIEEFLNKPWTLKQIVWKIDTDGTIERKHGSGWNQEADNY